MKLVGYQAANGHAQYQYGHHPGGMVNPQQNGQIAAYGHYSTLLYDQQGQVYHQRQ